MPSKVIKFDREMFLTTSFLKETGVKPVLFCYTEVVIVGPAVMVSLGPVKVVMIVKTLDMVLTESSLRDNNKNDDEPHYFGLIT